MSTSEIEALLAKFYEGNSTLPEEKALRDFFMSGDVPENLKPHQPLFAYYDEEKRLEFPDRDLEQELTVRFTKKSAETPVIRLHQYRGRVLFITGIAASVLLLLGLFYSIQHDLIIGPSKTSGSPDIKIAYADASEALLMVSGNLNNGLKQLERLQMVDKAMMNMQLFNKFYQYQTIIINPDEILNKSIKTKKP